MQFAFDCWNCGSKIKASSGSAGRRGRCPKCKNAVVIPDPEKLLQDKTITTDDIGDFEVSAVPPVDEEQGLPDWIASDADEEEDEFATSPPLVASPQREPKVFTPRDHRQHWLMDFLDFRMMISTQIIKSIWSIGTLLLLIGLLLYVLMIGVMQFQRFGITFLELLMLLALLLGSVLTNILWRLICESAIVFFKMHETLEEMNRNIERSGHH